LACLVHYSMMMNTAQCKGVKLMGIKVKVHHTGQSGAGCSLGRLNLIGEFDAVGLPGGGGPGQVNGFTLFLLLFRLRLKYFYVTYHGICKRSDIKF
jgi:hypothetical protein